MKNNKKKTVIKKKVSLQDRENSVFLKRKKICIIILVLLTAVLFSNTFQNDFTNWDDNDYVTENQHIRSLSPNGLKDIFSVFVSSHYHPLTLLSLAINFKLNGLHASGYIIGNILLHVLSVVFVFLIFLKLTNKNEIAFITALLFAIHPMRVESVVWISERKDVLNHFFYLFSLFFYLKYLKEGCSAKNYIIALILFICSILSKVTAASLPVLFFAFDYYTGRKFSYKLILDKLPFFAIAVVMGIVAIIAQSHSEPNAPPLLDKLFLATYAVTFYIVKFFTPLFQSAVIPFPEKAGAFLPFKYYLSFLIVPVLITVFFILKKEYRREYVFTVLFFLIPLGALLTKYPIGPAYLAERYTYLPHIGLAYFTGFLYLKLQEKFKLKNNFRNPFFVVLILFSVFFAIKTFDRNTVWKDSLTLWGTTIRDHPNTAAAYYNRGNYRSSTGDLAGAIEDYSKAVEIKPDYLVGYFNMANVKHGLNDSKGAIEDLNKAIRIRPVYPEAYFNKAIIHQNMGMYDSALNDINKVITFKFKLDEAYKIRGNTKSQLGEDTAAINDYDKALNYNKNSGFASEIYNNRGCARNRLKLFNEAIQDFNLAINSFPDNSLYYMNRASSYYFLGQYSSACDDWKKAAELGDTTAQKNVASFCR
ncbi:MAG TPA: tetratricopeptide repeat protein [Bacteroidales bacterium]|nr:tetratricopeptide repeat protein [Bacteroidales bacterium]